MSGQSAKKINRSATAGTDQLRTVSFAGLLLLLAGCVSSPTEALNLSDVLPPPPSNEISDPGVSKTGQFPNINNVPQGQTTQMSEAEKARLRESLASGQNRTSAAEAQAAEAAYKREVAEMRRLAKEQQRRIDAQNF